MTKLTIISPFPPSITGIGQYGFHVSRSLAQSGQFERVTVIAGAHNAPIPAHVSPSLSVRYAWRPDQPALVGALLSAVARSRPDVAWFNLGASVFGRSPIANLLGFLSLSLVRSAGIPTVATLHELVELADLKGLQAPGGPLAKMGARALTRLAARADVVCLTMRRYVNWFHENHPEIRSMHIPIGAYRSPERLPEPDGPSLLFFTTLAPYKGLEVLLSAYCRLLPLFPALRLTIAGTEHPRFPGYGDALRRQFASASGIAWLGQVPEEQVRSLFYNAQVVVLPYTASTGSSSVIYQSAMWGRALAASDLPETKLVADESGLEIAYFKNRDVEDLALSIRRLLDSPARRAAQVAHNYAAIQAASPQATARLYIQAFNQALEARHSPARIPLPAMASLETR